MKICLFLLFVILIPGGLSKSFSQTINNQWWRPLGQVHSIAKDTVNNIVYLGGDFQLVVPDEPWGEQVDLLSGTTENTYPYPNNEVRFSIPDGSGGWFISGNFTKVGSYSRNRLAHIDQNGQVGSLNLSINGDISCMILKDSLLYLSGNFTNIDGQSRHKLAAINILDETLSSWNPLLGPHPDLTINTMEIEGDHLYIGGDFFYVNGQLRYSLAQFELSTSFLTDWDPNVMGTVFTIKVHNNTAYIGGNFYMVENTSRHYAAALNTTTAQLTSWNPNADNWVRKLQFNGSSFIAMGSFTSIGGQARHYLAQLDTLTGSANSWNPDPNWEVWDIAIAGNTVYAAGVFTSIGGENRKNLAALDMANGMASSLNINPCTTYGLLTITSISVAGNKLYAGGNFSALNCLNRNRIVALDGATGMATSWNPNADGEVKTITLAGSRVFAGGEFTNIGGQIRNHLAELDPVSGSATAWDPNLNGNVNTLLTSGNNLFAGGAFTTAGGQNRNRIASINIISGAITSWNPNANNYVYTLAMNADKIYAGGAFTTIGGIIRNRVAEIDTSTGICSSWNPDINGEVRSLLLHDNSIFAGGSFTQAGGQIRKSHAKIRQATGEVTSWNLDLTGPVYNMASKGNQLMIGGYFYEVAGIDHGPLMLVDINSGIPLNWNPHPEGPIHDILWDEEALYVGGDFYNLYSSGITPASPAYFIVFNPCSNPVPTPSGQSDQAFCISALISDLTVAGNHINWYDSPTNGNWLDFSTQLIDGTQYYATQSNSCGESNSFAVNAQVIALPGAPTGDSLQTFCENSQLEDISVSGSTISWYATASSSSVLPANLLLSDGESYFATQQNQCGQSPQRLMVTIDINNIDNTITQNGHTLTANQTNASFYQWIDCDNGNTALAGETNQDFMPQSDGNYAVQITQNGCNETSSCHNYNTAELKNAEAGTIQLYPNPTQGFLTLDLGQLYPEADLTITDIQGHKILNKHVSAIGQVNFYFQEAAGIYFLQIDVPDHHKIIKFVLE